VAVDGGGGAAACVSVGVAVNSLRSRRRSVQYGVPGINDNTNYSNADFAKAFNSTAVQAALSSYVEQRVIAFEYGLEALADHPLRSTVRRTVCR
jgi:hypothetical protein